LCKKDEINEAINQYKTLLEYEPENFEALSNFIKLSKKYGKLNLVKSFFDKISKIKPSILKKPGYSFCLAQYQYFNDESVEALKNFNKSRNNKD
jgi:hypothetical protein